jgi:hypothetical protein
MADVDDGNLAVWLNLREANFPFFSNGVFFAALGSPTVECKFFLKL